MAEKALTLQILKQNQDGTVTALVKDDGAGTSPPASQGIRARINGINVWFESQADLLKADQMLKGIGEMDGGDDVPELGRGRSSRGRGRGRSLPTDWGRCRADGRRLSGRAGAPQ